MGLLIPQLIFISTFGLDLLIALFLPHSILRARQLSYAAVLLLSFSVSCLLLMDFSWPALLLAFVSTFRFINYYRVGFGRMKPAELASRFDRTAVVLAVGSLPVSLVAFSGTDIAVAPALSFASLFGSTIFLVNTVMSLSQRGVRHKPEQQNAKLPTVSVCIPARNETRDLPDCIESILASNYPKLEVLVLDDCSYDKTPALLKEYAHRGVRFITGKEPDEDWLAKNQALDKLYAESSGDILIFCGVDVRFSPDSVSGIIMQLQSGSDMVGVLPHRGDAGERSLFIQPLRYWWELAVPRFGGGRPPVLSSCWAIKRTELKKLGAFAAYRRSVQPEAHFAKALRQTYEFVVSGSRFGVSSVKAPREQFDTAVRTRYPQAKRRPETVMLLLMLELVVFFVPFGLLAGAVIAGGFDYFAWLAVTALLIISVTNALVSSLAVRRSWPVGLITWPLLLIEEWYVLIRSMLAYEFGIVIWKERNICLPMYQVDAKLPKM